jgi:hypothetical protein
MERPCGSEGSETCKQPCERKRRAEQRLVVSDRRCGGVDGRARSVMYISGDLLPAPRRSPKHGPARPMRHYLLQTRVEISTLQRNHHLEARIGITQAQYAAVRFSDLTAEIEP